MTCALRRETVRVYGQIRDAACNTCYWVTRGPKAKSMGEATCIRKRVVYASVYVPRFLREVKSSALVRNRVKSVQKDIIYLFFWVYVIDILLDSCPHAWKIMVLDLPVSARMAAAKYLPSLVIPLDLLSYKVLESWSVMQTAKCISLWLPSHSQVVRSIGI